MFFKFFKKKNKALVKKNFLIDNLKFTLDNIINEFFIIRQKMSNLEKVNMDLALYHKNKGDLKEAKIRFWIMSKLWPKNNEVKYQLAIFYINEDDKTKSRQFLQKISMPNAAMAKKISELESKFK